MSPRPAPRIAIIGAGAGGIGIGIRLRQIGIESFAIFEKSDGVGGTWHDNTYPGATCDAPSHFYSFSFAPNPNWSCLFAEQPEIEAYFEDCVERFGLGPHLRLGTAITSCEYEDTSRTWKIRTDTGEEHVADIVVSGLGQLNVPSWPDIPGRDDFAGTTWHSARWDHSHALAGERVGVIGNAASAVQFVPRIAPEVARLSVFQRSANWVLPKPELRYSDEWKRRFARHDWLRKLHRFQIYALFEARWSILHEGSRAARATEARAIKLLEQRFPDDPEMRAALTPDYPIGCKRMLISNDYLPALKRANVDLVTTPIDHITTDGIVTSDGTHREFDTIIYATGFDASNFLKTLEVTGREGQKLHDEWTGGAEAYLGIMVSGFPNFFMLYGPNTNLGTNSIIYMIEAQIEYVLRCIVDLGAGVDRALDVRPAAQHEYNDFVQKALAETVWVDGCHSWYKNESGKVTNNWPRTAIAYRLRTRRPDPKAFVPGASGSRA